MSELALPVETSSIASSDSSSGSYVISDGYSSAGGFIADVETESDNEIENEGDDIRRGIETFIPLIEPIPVEPLQVLASAAANSSSTSAENGPPWAAGFPEFLFNAEKRLPTGAQIKEADKNGNRIVVCKSGRSHAQLYFVYSMILLE